MPNGGEHAENILWEWPVVLKKNEKNKISCESWCRRSLYFSEYSEGRIARVGDCDAWMGTEFANGQGCNVMESKVKVISCDRIATVRGAKLARISTSAH